MIFPDYFVFDIKISLIWFWFYEDKLSPDCCRKSDHGEKPNREEIETGKTSCVLVAKLKS